MIPLRLSQRANNTPSSPIRKLAPFAKAAEDRGVKLYKMNIGQPDIESPIEFLEGIRNFDSPLVAYESSQGNPELRKAWCEFMSSSINIPLSEDSVFITMGASEGLIFTFMTLCDPGDEVVVFDPTYANYIGFSSIAGVKLVPVRSEQHLNYALPSSSEIEKKFSNRTRAILLCNPNNPTGTVYNSAELERLLTICEAHNIFLVVDETYREIVFDGRKPLSILNIAPNSDRVVVLDSISKKFSLCGARIGCILSSNKSFQQAILNLGQARLAAPTIEQSAVAKMFSSIDLSFIDKMVKIFQNRRDTLFSVLSKHKEIEILSPMGAFYCVAKLGLKDAESFCKFLLKDFRHNNETVFIAPAKGFFIEPDRGNDKIRIGFVLNEEKTKRAAELLVMGLKKYINEFPHEVN